MPQATNTAWLGEPPSTTRGCPPAFMVAVGVLTAASLILGHGFRVAGGVERRIPFFEVVLAAAYIADQMISLLRSRRALAVIRERKFEFGAVLLLIALMLGWWLVPGWLAGHLIRPLRAPNTTAFFVDAIELFLLVNVLIQLLRLQQRILVRGRRPELILTASFALLITAGTLLLLLPRAAGNPHRPLSVVDALFTSTSASCVTGLSVRNTGTAFSLLGQVIILALIQVGGLGIMTFVAFLSVTSAESLPMAHMLTFKHILGVSSVGRLKNQVWAIVLATGLIELVGAACLYVSLPLDWAEPRRVGWSIFHSISAFCNAGFSLQSDSLIFAQANTGINLTIMGLIVLGGLGFLVIPDLARVQVSRLPLIRTTRWARRINQHSAPRRLSIQTRLSLMVTGGLILVGMIGFWVLEAHHILRDKSWLTSFWISAFQSITPRTAGFNTVPMNHLQSPTQVLLMALMVVGACPVSTGGGIKAVTFGVLLLVLRTLITGRSRVEVFGRALPMKVLFAALSVFVLYVLVTVLGVFALAFFNPHLPLRDETFEAISALSTVGLSLGITTQLSVAGKLVLCALMFIGRVGPIALVLSVFQSEPRVRYQLPEEEVVVG